MSVEFDPEWEYYTSDPEVQELIDESGRGLKVYDNVRSYRNDWSSGFGFGKHPHQKTYLGKERPTRQTTLPNFRICKGCQFAFVPVKMSQVHCSMLCYSPPGRKKQLPPVRLCCKCSSFFKPLWSKHNYCSKRCGGSVGKPQRPPQHVLDQFAADYTSGKPVKDICARFGISIKTSKRWRSWAGLSPREAGHPKGKGYVPQLNHGWLGRLWSRLESLEGMTRQEIATLFGSTVQAVRSGIWHAQHRRSQSCTS